MMGWNFCASWMHAFSADTYGHHQHEHRTCLQLIARASHGLRSTAGLSVMHASYCETLHISVTILFCWN